MLKHSKKQAANALGDTPSRRFRIVFIDLGILPILYILSIFDLDLSLFNNKLKNLNKKWLLYET
jgi:hypothetical protein